MKWSLNFNLSFRLKSKARIVRRLCVSGRTKSNGWRRWLGSSELWIASAVTQHQVPRLSKWHNDEFAWEEFPRLVFHGCIWLTDILGNSLKWYLFIWTETRRYQSMHDICSFSCYRQHKHFVSSSITCVVVSVQTSNISVNDIYFHSILSKQSEITNCSSGWL